MPIEIIYLNKSIGKVDRESDFFPMIHWPGMEGSLIEALDIVDTIITQRVGDSFVRNIKRSLGSLLY